MVTVYIEESQPSGTYLAHVSVTDRDDGENEKTQLTVVNVVKGENYAGNTTGIYFIVYPKKACD